MFGNVESRKGEMESEMGEIRHDHDVLNQESEATITLKVNELRQANDSESIERYERHIERQLTEMMEVYQRFTVQQGNTLKAFQNVIGKEMEVYEFHLQDYCNVDEEDLAEMEPWTAPDESAYMTKLTIFSQNARDKWSGILRRRLKKKQLEEEKKTETSSVKRHKFTNQSSKKHPKVVAEVQSPRNTYLARNEKAGGMVMVGSPLPGLKKPGKKKNQNTSPSKSPAGGKKSGRKSAGAKSPQKGKSPGKSRRIERSDHISVRNDRTGVFGLTPDGSESKY